MDFLVSLFWFSVLIGLLVFAHEGGHFLFAKLFRVKVLTFSLGFGTPIRLGKFKLSWTPGETEYRVAWLPIGGFVRMLGEDPTEEVKGDDRQRAFSTQRPWKRFFIIFGGPLFSMLLAIPIYFAYSLGQGTAAAPVVGYVEPGSPAAMAGILPGDKLLVVGDKQVETWDDVDEGTQSTGGAPVEVSLERSGKKHEFRVKPVEEMDDTGLQLLGERWDLGLRHFRQGNVLGVVPHSPAYTAGLRSWDKVLEVNDSGVNGWQELKLKLDANGNKPIKLKVVRAADIEVGAVIIVAPSLVSVTVQPVPSQQAPPGCLVNGGYYFGIEPVDLYVMGVMDDYPAKKAGIVPGDKIVSMFGKSIFSWEQFARIVVSHPDDEIPIRVRHGVEIRSLTIHPKIIEEKNEFKQVTRKPGMGVMYKHNVLTGETIPRPHLFTYALRMSVVQTWRAMSMNVMGFVRIFQGRVPATEAIGGPLTMFNVAGKSAKRGFGTFISVAAFLSLLLGMLNLLPIPVLDGGHIMFIIIEAIRRKPVSIEARIIASYVGVLLLASLMAFAFFSDITRYWSNITSFFG